MMSQYLKTSVRLALKKPLLPVLNLLGLSLGIGCFMVISLYLYQEHSYEKDFKDYERIYRVEENFLSMGQLAWTSGNMPYQLAEMPFVENQTRVGGFSGEFKVKVAERDFSLKTVLRADSSFLKLFNYELLQGNAQNALNGPNKIILSEATALKMFGRTDVIGETLSHPDFGAFQVTGVSQKSVLKSHLDFDALASAPWDKYSAGAWFGIGGYSYVKLKQGSNLENLNEALDRMTEEVVYPVIYANGLKGDDPLSYQEWSQSANKVTFYAKPIRDVYLNSHLQFELGPNGDRQTRLTLTIVGVFILVVAGINFMNLTTARSSLRVKEIGVKKVLGARKAALVRQVLLESLVFTVLAALIGAASSELFVWLINQRLGEVIGISVFTMPEFLVWNFIGLLLLGLVAGGYPALYLSRAKMLPLLKGKMVGSILNMKSAGGVRNGLVVLQFVISSALIASSIVVYQQLNHLREMNLGFAKDQVVIVKNAYELRNNKQAFKNELLNIPGINAASYTARVPVDGSNSTLSTMLDSETTLTFAQFFSDEDLHKALDLELLDGEWFDPNMERYDSLVIVNESAINAMGLKDPVGQVFGNYYRIIGVVKDFFWGNLREEVGPAVLFAAGKTQNKLAINLNPVSASMQDVEKLWSEFSAEAIDIEFLDQSFQDQILKEKQGIDAVLVFTVLAILIACLGLFGLAVFHADQRKHEFGIRRVLGASLNNLAGLFSFQFVRLIIIAFLISIPLAIYGLQLWLNGFANRVELGAGVFVFAAIITLVISLLTLLVQSIKVASTNAVETLRNE